MFDEVPEPVWKLVVELAGGDTFRGRRDPLSLVGVEQAELGVHPRGGTLDPPEPVGHRGRNGLA
jgi:hypothetical protein